MLETQALKTQKNCEKQTQEQTNGPKQVLQVQRAGKTEANACEEKRLQIDTFKSYIPEMGYALLGQHDIAAKISNSTSSADKLIRMLSNTIKAMKSYGVSLKGIEKLASQLGQLRRLLRIDRLLIILKDYQSYFKKISSKFQIFLLTFKFAIFTQDLVDIRLFLIQLKVIKGQSQIPELRKKIANMYFLECVGWLVNYTHQYLRAQSSELRKKNLIVILRYVMDAVISHNEFSRRMFTLDPKITSFMAVCSSVLNLYLIWK